MGMEVGWGMADTWSEPSFGEARARSSEPGGSRSVRMLRFDLFPLQLFLSEFSIFFPSVCEMGVS